MKLIYIGHPLGGDGSPEWGNRDQNMERYLHFVAHASNQGHCVISWVHHHLCRNRGLTPRDGDDFYLVRDKELLRFAHEMWQAGPLHVSGGLRFEVEAAQEFGIPVIHRPEWDLPLFRPPLRV
jgi:hypothetical protein